MYIKGIQALMMSALKDIIRSIHISYVPSEWIWYWSWILLFDLLGLQNLSICLFPVKQAPDAVQVSIPWCFQTNKNKYALVFNLSTMDHFNYVQLLKKLMIAGKVKLEFMESDTN